MKLSELSRRDWFKNVGLGLGAAAVGVSASQDASADFVTKKVAQRGTEYTGKDAVPCTLSDGKVSRPASEIPAVSETDVLVVGGGPAGCCAAIAAARAGVKVTLVERYNHFGGLATGGLVLIILGHWTTNKAGEKVQVVQGIGEEMMKRLEGLPNGICNRNFGRNPTIDAEVYKYLLVEMLMESNIELFLHSWAIDAIVDDSPDAKTGNPVVKGAVIQTKLGPQAILAKQVIDTTGDGDVFAYAGCAYTRRLYHIGLPCRLGNTDKIHVEPGTKVPYIGDITPIKGVRWLNMQGPDADGLDVRELTKLELNSRRQIWKNYINLKNTPGCEDVFLMETAPQLGVRITRVLEGTEEMTLEGAKAGQTFDSCVGYGGAWQGDHIGWQIPYGALISKNVENILTGGRSICGAPSMSELLRVIPNCWSSGHSVGVAAACAVKQNCTARDVNLNEVRRVLKEQGAYLG